MPMGSRDNFNISISSSRRQARRHSQNELTVVFFPMFKKFEGVIFSKQKHACYECEESLRHGGQLCSHQFSTSAPPFAEYFNCTGRTRDVLVLFPAAILPDRSRVCS
jgi:hypothetical protein